MSRADNMRVPWLRFTTRRLMFAVAVAGLLSAGWVHGSQVAVGLLYAAAVLAHVALVFGDPPGERRETERLGVR
jgi:hypothetical protein